MDISYKSIVLCDFLVNLLVLIEAHLMDIDAPPVIPPNLHGVPPLYTGPNNVYFSKYFPPREHIRRYSQGGINQRNVAKYGGFQFNSYGSPRYLNNLSPAISFINRAHTNRRPPVNPGSVFIRTLNPSINVNKFFQSPVQVTRGAFPAMSDDEDDEGGANRELFQLIGQGPLIGGVQPFHHGPRYHGPLRMPPPFDLFPTQGDQPTPPSDIIFVIYTSHNLGHAHPTGKAIWHSGLMDFINQFVRASNMGPSATRIGAVIIGHLGVEGLIPMMSDQTYFLHSLTNTQSSFRGQCSDRGLLVAKSMLYQYSRPVAAKRIVLVTDEADCGFRTMPGMLIARERGIDVIHVKFGAYVNGLRDGIPPGLRPYWTVPIRGDVGGFVTPIADRVLMPPLHGGWSPWSAWNQCSARGECRVGHQMRFRICDNPRPSFGGRPCQGFPTETRFCRQQQCAMRSAGYWTPWSVFSPCSSNCGRGTRTRSRMCLTFDGQPSVTCTGNYVDTRDCAVTVCPAVGEWSIWSGWGICSTPCGPGIQVRTRLCDQPLPQQGGPLCPGPSVDERVCVIHRQCPIHGGFGPWREIGRCDVPCGRGRQRFIRECNSPFPQYGGMPCNGRFEMRRPCNTGVMCPIPGGWSRWSVLSPCSVSCGRGVTFRRRTCNTPVPRYHGSDCVGPSIEEHECDTGIACPIDGQWSVWIETSPCSVNCGTGHMQRARYCNNPAPLYGGRVCFGSPTDAIPCDTGIPCPVDGGWGPWSEPTPCNVRCGTGIQTRHRECNNPVPNGGSSCVGLDRDQRSCDTGIICPKNGVWSSWMPWGVCSAECGAGIRQHNRVCKNPFQIPDGEMSCIGSPVQEEVCETGINCPVHGGWSQWSEPKPCSATCGIGSTMRVRYCNTPEPDFGGEGCLGPTEEFLECKSAIECPIDGGWSLWVDWGPCIGTCGLGSQRRSRACNSPAPMHLGADCLGDIFEKRSCGTGIHCPIDGEWSLWRVWNACSAECGTGMKTRHRQCDAPSPLYGGLPCSGLEMEEGACSAATMCPVDGGWSSWSPFTACSVSCGAGIMTRSRLCENPLPMHLGKMCVGHTQEDIPCDTQVECPVHGGWSPWGQLSPCSASCGAALQERSRACNSPYPLFDGNPCFGDAIERVQCQRLPPCPVHGQWSDWTPFGPCDVPCGNGLKRRTRLCNNPTPLYGGDSCHGYPVNEVVCDAPIQCPVDGNWSPWSQFSVCSVTCGIGVQLRKRLCNNPPPLFSGAYCFGAPLDETECRTVPCPINGGWTLWSEYDHCSASCGKGVQRRIRECTNPPPRYRGLECEGPVFEDSPCSSGIKCPVHGGWSLWSDWALCSSICGTGMSERVRACSNPPPLFGGQTCQGNNREEMPCETGIACPVDGGWSRWSEYTPCSAQCGEGVKQRNRVCNSPVPQYKGKDCPGTDVEGIACNTGSPCPVDGGFSFWSHWSPCLVDCGKGIQTRTRLCDSPPPLHGGKQCFGDLVEERVCHSDVACPIDGQWGPWSTYTSCFGSCGIGTQERSRICDNPIPLYGGLACKGLIIDIQPCDTGSYCPVHGNWNFWMPWSACSVSCGMGMQKRNRLCSNPEPMYGGKPCVGGDNQEQLCNMDVPCPVHGGFSFWSEWGPCSVKCGTGIQSRLRLCDSPQPLNGGKDCFGDFVEDRDCVSDISCPIDGSWGQWTPWPACPVVCGIGMQRRNRLCSNPEPMHGGQPCIGGDYQEQPCDTGMFCPVNGNWGLWTEWQPCDATCGQGVQIRVRNCDNPPKKYNGLPCFGDNKEALFCDSGKPCPVDGYWSLWSEWSVCSVSCGVGNKERVRTCSSPAPTFGGRPCNGSPVESLKCLADVNCPVNGHWTMWTPWSTCSKTCGFGTQLRVRECADPIPAFGGTPCVGVDKEVNNCFNNCPVPGNWSPWSEKGPCSSPCGVGVIHRTRTCTDPAPAYGGLDCNGPVTGTVECQIAPCPVDGGWSPWYAWSHCQGTCGFGIKVRLRECTNPLPLHGGQLCTGIDHEAADCNTNIPCPVDGQWSLWGPWEACNALCGIGKQIRQKACTNPAPSHGGRTCLGIPTESIKCDTGILCPVDGNWAPWSGWSICDAECGVGAQVKIRYCTDPKPQNGGLSCVGFDKKSRLCDSGKLCSVDGNWAVWSSWTTCDVSCGTGQHTRHRTCSNPRPKMNGLLCQGVPEEKKPCQTGIPCRTEGTWGYWSQWSRCSTDCGMGQQLRSRQCYLRQPSKYPVFCPGVGDEQRMCRSADGCPIDGGWSSWEAWSVCSVTCGEGLMGRFRLCNNPTPMNGGEPCRGPGEETKACNSGTQCTRLGGWSFWSAWTSCSSSCGAGVQYRKRRCDSPSPIGQSMDCKGWPEDQRVCNTARACPIHGGWSSWVESGPCSADCSAGPAKITGRQTRQRSCDNPPPQNDGNMCVGNSLDTQLCTNFQPCSYPVWEPWGQWSTCSQECGEGFTERKRQCVDEYSRLPSSGCVGVAVQNSPCLERTCPTTDVNCSTECKWDNGIGYAPYPGDCSKFIQCDSLFGEPRIHDCPWGLLWSLEILQCVFPAQAECGLCIGIPDGTILPYFLTCKSYWLCNKGSPNPKCCPGGQKFDPLLKRCTPDPLGVCGESCPPVIKQTPAPASTVCLFRASPKGTGWYEQQISGVWITRPCGLGTVFSEAKCGCIAHANASAIWRKKECLPELHLTFDTLQRDLDRNVGIHMENVTYLGDGTALFNGTAAINSNIFSNTEWGNDVFVYIRFKPEGKGKNQGLVHNSGCGPSDVGPSVFIGLDRTIDLGPNKMNMKFASVPRRPDLQYEFINVTVPDNKLIDAWFKFSDGYFRAEVDGTVAELNVPGRPIARRHGAINIAGNLCRIGNEAFGGFQGILDEVRIYKCKPPRYMTHTQTAHPNP